MDVAVLAPMGYHQICVVLKSQMKLAFAGPNATKWTYTIMPLSPVNGPFTFIAFIHDIDLTWNNLACYCGLTIDKDTNTNIIVNNMLSWAKTLLSVLLYMECQLHVAQSQQLSLSLKNLTASLNVLSLLGSMFVPTAIALLNLNTSCCIIGPSWLLFGTLPNLLGSSSSTLVSFPTSK
jgi:hypothetical protein